MKKFILVAAVLVALGVDKALAVSVPEGASGDLATSDYGGVGYSTVAFSSAGVILFGASGGSIAKLHVSSFGVGSLNTDYFSIRSTGALITGAVSGGQSATDDYNTSAEIFRVYLGSVAAHGWSGNNFTGLDYEFHPPLKLPIGAVGKWSVNTIPLSTIQRTKFGGSNAGAE